MRVLIIGGSSANTREALEAIRLFTPDRIIAVNHAGIYFPLRVDAWVTLHPDEFLAWQIKRAEAGYNTDYEAITFLHADRRERTARLDRYHPRVWPGQRNSGSSGLFAIKVALDDGATHVVLAGIPIDAEHGHFFRDGPWLSAESYQETWTGIAHEFRGRVRSMGGWTMRTLGYPTPQWLAAPPADEAEADRRPGADAP